MNAGRTRQLLAAPVSVALVALMLLGCLFLWVGAPLGWLWVGSQIEAGASLSWAIVVMMVGIVATILAVVSMLSWINRRHMAVQQARNRPPKGSSALEVMLVTSAGIALVGFGIWFFGFAGTSPVPLNVSF